MYDRATGYLLPSPSTSAAGIVPEDLQQVGRWLPLHKANAVYSSLVNQGVLPLPVPA